MNNKVRKVTFQCGEIIKPNKTILIQRGEIINLKLGAGVLADVPSMYCGGSFFDTSNTHKEIIIGETYSRRRKNIQELAKEVFEQIKHLVPVSEDQITNFLLDLNLDLEAKIFDTSIYAGEHNVIFAGYDHPKFSNFWHVFCQKVDNPSIKLDFYQIAD